MLSPIQPRETGCMLGCRGNLINILLMANPLLEIEYKVVFMRYTSNLTPMKAITEYEELEKLCERAMRFWEDNMLGEALQVYERLIPDVCNWLQTYKLHIQAVSQPGYPNRWMRRLEEIKIYWIPQFTVLLASQQLEHPLREIADQTQDEINQFLENLFYSPTLTA